MQLTVARVDCSEFVKNNQPPIAMIRRHTPRKGETPFAPGTNPPPLGRWYVPAKTVPLDGSPVEWVLTKQGETVRVPLFAYLTRDESFETLFGCGVQIGVTVALEIPEKKIDKLHLFIGNVWRPTADAGRYQAWLGLAFRMEE